MNYNQHLNCKILHGEDTSPALSTRNQSATANKTKFTHLGEDQKKGEVVGTPNLAYGVEFNFFNEL